MLFGNSKKNQHKNLELILDVRSATVGGSILQFSTEKPEVLYSVRVPISSTQATDASKVVPTMLKALSSVLESVVKEGLSVSSDVKNQSLIKKITIVYGAPWYESKTKNLVLKKEKPFLLSRNTFEKLVAKQIAVDQEQVNGRSMIEHDTTKVVINGYQLDNPFNKKTNEITISLYASFLSEQTLNYINQLVDEHFHKTQVVHRTFPFILFTTLRSMFWNVDNFTFFDISGTMTEIGIVVDGSLAQVLSIPVGKYHLQKDIADSCQLQETTAASVMSMIARGEMHPSCNPSILDAYKKAEKKWIDAVQKVVDDNNLSLSQRVFLTVDQDAVSMFKTMISSIEVRKNIFSTDQELHVAVLQAEHFKSQVSIPQHVPLDTFAALTTVFLQTLK